jgi:hypothetical protein
VVSGKEWQRPRVQALLDCLNAVPGIDHVAQIFRY